MLSDSVHVRGVSVWGVRSFRMLRDTVRMRGPNLKLCVLSDRQDEAEEERQARAQHYGYSGLATKCPGHPAGSRFGDHAVLCSSFVIPFSDAGVVPIWAELVSTSCACSAPA